MNALVCLSLLVVMMTPAPPSIHPCLNTLQSCKYPTRLVLFTNLDEDPIVEVHYNQLAVAITEHLPGSQVEYQITYRPSLLLTYIK